MKKNLIGRRNFLRATLAGAVSGTVAGEAAAALSSPKKRPARKPNLLYILGDQWRAQAVGYAGNPDVITPNIDRLSKESLNLSNAVSGCPVCSPYRASLMTGRYPLSNGVFVNDVYLNTDAVSFAQAFNRAGYNTGLIGKWHLDGHGSRSAYIPRERRQGFDFWKALECTHNYNNSYYYGDENVRRMWDGYDAIAQTREAQRYIREHDPGKPFALVLSWGPPHAPYLTAPQQYREMFGEDTVTLRPNVPKEHEAAARRDIAGYYAHIAALDECIGALMQTLKECGLEDDTILVFTSDHGDLLYSHGQTKKQQPWEESVQVPFLIRCPALFGRKEATIDMPFNAPDIMPTLLGLCGVEVPRTVEGEDFSGVLTGDEPPRNEAVLYSCPQPFGQWIRKKGGKECRGVRTRRHTYVRDLNGPWLLFDNQRDPYQLDNLVDRADHAELQAQLEHLLTEKLRETKDEFLPGPSYIKRWGYVVDENETVPYTE